MHLRLIRTIMLAGILVCAIMVAFQIFVLVRLDKYEGHEFDLKVAKMVEDAAWRSDHVALTQQNLNSPKDEVFWVRGFQPANKDLFLDKLYAEVKHFELHDDVVVNFYESGKLAYNKKLQRDGIVAANNQAKQMLPANEVTLELKFGNRYENFFDDIGFSILNGFINTLMLLAFSLSLYLTYRTTFNKEMQKDFLQNFAHEFKMPLSVMKLTCENVMDEKVMKSPEKFEEYGKIMQEQIETLNLKVNKILELSQSEKQLRNLELEVQDFVHLVNNAVFKMDPLLKAKKAAVKVMVDGLVPPVLVDRLLMEVVVMNLLDNALKYCKEDPRIEVNIVLKHHFLSCQVADNGIGINAIEKQDIFKKFYRSDDALKMQQTGFGLGLGICKKIVEAHGGKISVADNPLGGTAFLFTIPSQKQTKN
jgi:signal transduction histidine kinase